MSKGIRLLSVLLSMCLLFAGTAAAQTYPSRLITIIVNVGPGGVTDLVARLFADYVAKKGHQAVILNRPGAGGNIAMAALAQASPDGYTLGASSAGTLVINPYLFKSMPFDPIKDVIAVAPLGENVQTLIVNGKLPVNSVQEFIAYAKANPGRVTYGSPGLGSTNHLGSDAFARAAGIDMVHVPFKGGAEAFAAVLSGTVQMVMVGSGIAAPHVATGAVKILATASPKRLRQLPDLPTIAEAGVAGVQMTTWYGLFAPKGTPDDIVQLLNTWSREAVNDPVAKTRLEANSVDPMTETPAEFSKRIASELKLWEDIVKQAGITPN